MSTGLETRQGLFAVMEQIASERETAREIVQQLLTSNAPLDDIDIPEGWRTAGMVMELAEFAFSGLEADPQQSLSLSLLTLAIAKSLACNPYPPTLRAYLEGRAWKEVGYANRYLDRYDNSIRAFESAEAAFSGEGALLDEEAGAQFARACVLFRGEKYDEAVALLPPIFEVFNNLGDQVRQAKCKFLDAMISQERGHIATARMKYEDLLSTLSQGEDLHTLGTLYQNLGLAYLDLGLSSDAVTAFGLAREIFVDLSMPSEVNRADWGLAIVLLTTGAADKALPLLTRLRADYLSRSMPAAAGEIGLHMVDALVIMQQIDAAKALSEQVLKEFTSSNLNSKAISALAYLRDVLQTARDPHRAIQHVRSYVKKLRSEPELLFLPIEDSE